MEMLHAPPQRLWQRPPDLATAGASRRKAEVVANVALHLPNWDANGEEPQKSVTQPAEAIFVRPFSGESAARDIGQHSLHRVGDLHSQKSNPTRDGAVLTGRRMVFKLFDESDVGHV